MYKSLSVAMAEWRAAFPTAASVDRIQSHEAGRPMDGRGGLLLVEVETSTRDGGAVSLASAHADIPRASRRLAHASAMHETTLRPSSQWTAATALAACVKRSGKGVFAAAALLVTVAVLANESHAQNQTEGVEPYIEYKKRIETAQNISLLDNGLFGDIVSLYNGSTSFTVVDIDLPGNNSLPVTLARTIAIDLQPQGSGPAYDTLLRGIGNWQVDVPHMAATYPQSTGWYSNRCSGGSVPPLFSGQFSRVEYWNGISVHVPGRGGTSALGPVALAPKPTTAATYRLTTTERDYFDCIPMQSGLAGEGFRMTTTSGLKYYFNVGVVRTASRLQTVRAGEGGGEIYHFLGRNKYYLLASKIEDPLGNTVNFEYNASGHPTKISASDGREILLNYSSGRLVSATADGRIWQYEYSPNAYFDPNPDLVRVIQPDASRWEYAYTGTLKPPTPPPSDSLSLPWCQGVSAGVEQVFTVLATHPSGAQGQFNFNNTRHYRSGVHATECLQHGDPFAPSYTQLVPHYFDVMSLLSKTISGPGLTPSTWTYNYGTDAEFMWGSSAQSPVYPCTTCNTEKLVVVTNPDGSKRRHRFGKMYRFNDGRTLGTDIVSTSGAVLRSESNVYLSEAEASSQMFHGVFGSVLGGIADPVSAQVRPVVSTTTQQQARNFVWRVDATCGSNGTTYCFDSLARPTKVVKSSAPAP